MMDKEGAGENKGRSKNFALGNLLSMITGC